MRAQLYKTEHKTRLIKNNQILKNIDHVIKSWYIRYLGILCKLRFTDFFGERKHTTLEVYILGNTNTNDQMNYFKYFVSS